MITKTKIIEKFNNGDTLTDEEVVLLLNHYKVLYYSIYEDPNLKGILNYVNSNLARLEDISSARKEK